MPERLRLYDCRQRGLPAAVGLCKEDILSVAEVVNSAQRRLLFAKEAGDEGWWGTWAEMAFSVGRSSPYLTTPRGVARIEALNVCTTAVPVENQFYEYLQFGNGRLPKLVPWSGTVPNKTAVYSRNVVPTFVDLSPAPQFIRLYAADPADLDGQHRVLIQGVDSNDVTLLSPDGVFQATGSSLTLTSPFAQLAVPMKTITGLQKYVTRGPVQVFQVDPTTGAQVLLVTMEPSEQVAAYRRYYVDNLPRTPDPLTVTAIVKLDLIPVQVDSDYCLIQNIEALKAEAQSERYSKIDSVEAKNMSRERHQAAIGYLKGELSHYLGVDSPAVNFAPFGTARLDRLNLGMQ